MRKKFEIKDIDKVIFEKSKGEIAVIQIFVDEFNDKYFDVQNDFDKLIDYLLANVEEEKIICYALGTKKEMPL